MNLENIEKAKTLLLEEFAKMPASDAPYAILGTFWQDEDFILTLRSVVVTKTFPSGKDECLARILEYRQKTGEITDKSETIFTVRRREVIYAEIAGIQDTYYELSAYSNCGIVKAKCYNKSVALTIGEEVHCLYDRQESQQRKENIYKIV